MHIINLQARVQCHYFTGSNTREEKIERRDDVAAAMRQGAHLVAE
jgi:hypothetical protein